MSVTLFTCLCMFVTVHLRDSMSVSPSVHLPAHLSVTPSVHLLAHLSDTPSVHLSDHLSIHLSVCLPMWLSFCLSTCLPICLSLHRSTCLTICLWFHQSTCLTICLSVHLPTHLSVIPSVHLPAHMSITLAFDLSSSLCFVYVASICTSAWYGCALAVSILCPMLCLKLSSIPCRVFWHNIGCSVCPAECQLRILSTEILLKVFKWYLVVCSLSYTVRQYKQVCKVYHTEKMHGNSNTVGVNQCDMSSNRRCWESPVQLTPGWLPEAATLSAPCHQACKHGRTRRMSGHLNSHCPKRPLCFRWVQHTHVSK